MSASHAIKAVSRATDLRLVAGPGLVDLAKPGLSESLQVKLDGERARYAERMKEGPMAAALATGLEEFAELLDANVVEVAGPKGKHNAKRSAVRHGNESAKVPMGGRDSERYLCGSVVGRSSVRRVPHPERSEAPLGVVVTERPRREVGAARSVPYPACCWTPFWTHWLDADRRSRNIRDHASLP